MARTEKNCNKTRQTKKIPVASKAQTKNSSIKTRSPVKKAAVAPKKNAGAGVITAGSNKVKRPKMGKGSMKLASTKMKAGKGTSKSPKRYKCRLCGYIYSPLRGEPQYGIPAGTEFDDLPEDYVCPLCGYQGKGKIGKWGFEEWHPTKYICAVCGYVYDENRGEPHRGIKPGTKFEDLPDNYVCPVCALDLKSMFSLVRCENKALDRSISLDVEEGCFPILF